MDSSVDDVTCCPAEYEQHLADDDELKQDCRRNTKPSQELELRTHSTSKHENGLPDDSELIRDCHSCAGRVLVNTQQPSDRELSDLHQSMQTPRAP